MLKSLKYGYEGFFKVLSSFALLYLIFASNQVTAQSVSISDDFKKTVDSLIEAGPKTYKELDAVLRPVRSDTVFMNFFEARAAEKKYLDGQTYALNQLGRKYRNISDFAKSLDLHRKALTVAEAAKNVEFEVYSLNMISVVYRKTDAIKSSLDYSQQALALAETIAKPSEGIKRSMNVSSNNIANIYMMLEQYDLAIERFEKSIVLDKELDNNLGLAINYQNIGVCYEAQGRLEKALENLQTSLSYNEKIDSDRGRVICNYSIAHVFVHQNKEKEALHLLESALPVAVRLDDKKIISSVHINMGWTLTHLGRYKIAEEHLLKGREIAAQYNLLAELEEADKFLSELFVAKGNYKKALEYYKSNAHFKDVISTERNLRYVDDVIYYYDYEKKNSKIEVLEKQNEIAKLRLRQNQITLWISGIVLALMAGIFYVLYRQFQLKNEKKVITLEQDMLRSQMNPHFLFNSLNSIKLYIINNEQKNAVHYLNKFSKLVRKILEASSVKEIALAEELETVELYMNIEDIRFSNEINFKITVADGVDPHLIKIPSLILQPFLENALWHGLSSKQGEKKIDLHVGKTEEDSIAITITDNGIGRAAAEKIKESKVLKRKSVGIDITKERLANFSKEFRNPYSLEMIDLFDDKGKATGTKVVLVIPTI
ncbi:tetratricopeptide repeat protein [Aggregatimonas sangjinii]|uniref:Tetratricopeptide repeat protein n=1 Tax=Aggregatimonas sangjinii TaxID=2583587 RepID=A0A5B7SW79_9FLAO|nr:tetratricopeptide repeat protein [Aggregatimonas sangjinii]QCX01579.1 tetratricopeptide repeat protein [Aggregatimonas sangjinii]